MIYGEIWEIPEETGEVKYEEMFGEIEGNM